MTLFHMIQCSSTLAGIFICQCILPLGSLFIHFSALLILFLYFHVSILLFPLFLCALVGPLLTDLDLQHQSLRRQMSHCSKEPRKTTKRESEVLILCILAFCLVMMIRCQNCIIFYFCLVMFSILYQIKTIVECLLCEMKLLVAFCIYVREFGSFTTT